MRRRDFLRTSALAAAGVALGTDSSRRGPGVRNVSPVDSPTKEILMAGLGAARASGASYADARLGLYRNRRLTTREERVSSLSDTSSAGIGVRALVNGSWGYAATNELTLEAALAAGRRATLVARSNAAVATHHVTLAPVKAYGDVEWTSAFEIDPFSIPLEDQIAHLLDLNRAALKTAGVNFASSSLHLVKIEQTTATTDGTVAAQTLVRLNPSMNITAISKDGSDFHTRSWVLYPQGRGYEYVLDRFTPSAVEQWADEAAMMLGAESVEPGSYDLILHPTHLWLTIHESIGHPTELDRALGYEANYAGTSFLGPPEEVIGKLRYGPEFMQIVGERTTPGSLAAIGWDEEGVEAHEWPMIKDGIFVDYQTTREQAGWISDLTGIEHSHGCAHGDSWSSIPFQRMPNMNLLPADRDVRLDDIIGATDRGLYIIGRNSYSIDQQRYNFQFSGQVVWEVRGGKLTRPLRDAAYQANTIDFWNSMDMIGGPSTYEVYGSFYDGKGQPGQVNPVSHGCPVARFRDVTVLNTRQSA